MSRVQGVSVKGLRLSFAVQGSCLYIGNQGLGLTVQHSG
jgi:hypothetical protein